MEPANFATTFHPADLRIITLIERILLPSVSNDKENSTWGRAISAELYKLNVRLLGVAPIVYNITGELMS